MGGGLGCEINKGGVYQWADLTGALVILAGGRLR